MTIFGDFDARAIQRPQTPVKAVRTSAPDYFRVGRHAVGGESVVRSATREALAMCRPMVQVSTDADTGKPIMGLASPDFGARFDAGDVRWVDDIATPVGDLFFRNIDAR